MTLHRSLPDVADSLSTELQDWAVRRHETMKWRESRLQEAGGGTECTILVGIVHSVPPPALNARDSLPLSSLARLSTNAQKNPGGL